MFWKPISAFNVSPLNATLQMQAGKSYVVKIKLKPNYVYLMSDGTTGHFKDTTFGGGSKTPIAVVIDKDSHMAVALNEANSGAIMQWCIYAYHYTQANTHSVTNMTDALTSQTTSGIDETWDPSYSTGSFGVKATNSDFHAFKAATDYNASVTYTGSPALQWYLPSYSDLKWLFSALGFGDKAAVTQGMQFYDWYDNLAMIALTQVGGATMINKTYWSSSEYTNDSAGYIYIDTSYVGWLRHSKNYGSERVRPFVKY